MAINLRMSMMVSPDGSLSALPWDPARTDKDLHAVLQETVAPDYCLAPLLDTLDASEWVMVVNPDGHMKSRPFALWASGVTGRALFGDCVLLRKADMLGQDIRQEYLDGGAQPI